MRIASLCCVVFCAGALTAQQSLPPVVRSIQVRLVPACETADDVSFETIAAAWKSKGINLEVEKRYDAAAVGKAAEVIRDLYRERGHEVRVKPRTTPIPPKSLEVTFEIGGLCDR